MTATDLLHRRLRLAKVVARTALALVWVYEGLVPKLLFTTQRELDLVARSHLYWPTPRATLTALAVGEIAGGLWLLGGRAERVAAAISVALLLFVGTACAVIEPQILYHPFGGLSKNLGLLGCALVVWLLAPISGAEKRGPGYDDKGGGRWVRRRSDNTAVPGQLPACASAGPSPWPRRLLLGFAAVAGTAAYAASFRTVAVERAAWLSPAGAAVGVAAGVSWLVFGAALLRFSRATPAKWADACLGTMATGIAVLTLGTAVNLAASLLGGVPLAALLALHGALLLAGNAVMATAFVREARRLGLRPAAAVAAWAGGLDGSFVVILMFLYRSGVL